MLFVDDDKEFLVITKEFLKKSSPSFEIITVSSGKEALQKLNEESFDAIVSDYQMPQMDGLELLENLRSKDNSIPFLMFTGRGREEVAMQALNLGADYYLMKNGDPQSLYGELVHVINTMIRQKQTEKDLYKSEKKYRELVENLQEGVVVEDSEGKFTFINSKVVKMLGYQEEELLGQHWSFLVPESELELIQQEAEKRLRGVSSSYETILKKKDCQRISVLVHATPLFSSEKVFRGVLVAFTNIMKLKQTETALRESEERYRNLSEAAFEGIIIHEKGVIIDSNQTFARLLGYNVSEVIGKNGLAFAAPDYRDLVLQNILKGYEKPYEAVALRKDGSTFPTEMMGRNAYYHGRHVRITAFRDVTERKEAEKNLIRLNTVLQTIRNVNQLSVREKNQQHLLQGVCDIFVETRGFGHAYVVLIDENTKPIAIAEANLGKEFLDFEEQLKKGELPICMQQTLEQAEILIIDDPQTTCTDCQLLGAYGNRMRMCGRLEFAGKIYGLLTLSLPTDLSADQQEQTLFAEVLDDIAYALHNLFIEDKHQKTLKNLENSEDKYRNLFHKSNDAIFIHDLGGHILDVNEKVLDLFGYSRSEILTLKISNLHPSEVLDQSRRNFEIISKEHAVQFETDFKKKNGSIFPAEVSSSLFEIENRKVIQGIVRDISDRKQAEIALEKSQTSLASIFRAAPVGIGLVSNRVIREVNDRFCVMTGYLREELLDQNTRLLYPTDKDYEMVGQEKYAQMAVLGIGTVETRLKMKTGQIIDVLLTSTPLDTQNLSKGATFTVLDITDWKRAEKKLRESERSYQSLFHNAPITYLSIGNDGKVKDANQAAKAFTGYHLEELQQMNVFDLYADESKTKGQQLFERFQKGEKWENEEMIYQKKNGQKKIGLLSINTIYDENVQILKSCSVIVDITERKHMEESLRQQREELSEFAHVLAHDLKNYLFNIELYTNLLQEEYNKTNLSKILQSITQIREFLNYSLIMADIGLVIEKSDEINLTELIQNVMTDLIPETIKFELDQLPNVVGDRNKLKQVFQNLLGNAVIHGHPKRISINCQKEANKIDILIINDGFSIPEAHRDKIFERGFTTLEGRQGYGLAIVRKIIEAHGWKIVLKPKLETTFCITI